MVLSGATALYIGNTSYSKAYVGDIQVWPSSDTGYSSEYLTFEIISAGTIRFTSDSSSAISKEIQYSINNGAWDTIDSVSNSGFTVSAGDLVRFKGTNARYCTLNDTSPRATFQNSTAVFNVYGNIMSFIYGDNFIGQTALDPGGYNFVGFFSHARAVNAENLVLPATTLSESCYQNMFTSCSRLTTAPALPATTLAKNCYSDMFRFSSLTTAPILPATTLQEGCYQYMFKACTSLTSAPILPATTLAKNCYLEMFWGCTSLTSAPILPATTLQEGCYYYMFRGCSNLSSVKCLATDISAYQAYFYWLRSVSATGTFTKAAGVSWPLSNVGDGIPNNWTVIEE